MYVVPPIIPTLSGEGEGEGELTVIEESSALEISKPLGRIQ